MTAASRKNARRRKLARLWAAGLVTDLALAVAALTVLLWVLASLLFGWWPWS